MSGGDYTLRTNRQSGLIARVCLRISVAWGRSTRR